MEREFGVGSHEDAQRTTQWARWLLRGGMYSNEDSQPRLDSSSNSQSSSECDLGVGATFFSPEKESEEFVGRPPHILPVSQDHIRENLKYAEPARLRFWLKILREEVVREAAYNNHQSILISQLRSLVDAQQRELVAARVALCRMKGNMRRRELDAEARQNISAISHDALRMAGKSRLDAQDERESMMIELERLRKENERLRMRV